MMNAPFSSRLLGYLALAACIQSLPGSPALAQAPDTLTILDPVVVSAALSPTQSSKTGRNIIIIKGEQIANLPVNSVDELLRYLPGLEVQARGPMGVQSDISIRGTTFQQVLVVLDGVRLNDPLTGHFSSYVPLPASAIERIEILKGAASAIYGTEAVGGVVHIISKTFARTQKGKGLQAQLTGGEYGLWGINAGAHLTGENTSVSAGILSNHAQGQPQRGTTGFFDLTTVSLSVQHRISPRWSAAWRSAYDSRDFSAQNFYTTFASDTATEKVTSWWHHGQLIYQHNRLRWVTDAGFKKLQDIFAFNGGSVPNNNRTQVLQLLSRAEYAFSEKSTLTAGIQLFDRQIRSNDRGNHTVGQYAAFVAWQQEVVPGLTIAPALRLDINETSGTEWVPQLNVSYKQGNYQLRGSAGRTIREPDFTERYNNFNRALVPSGRIGNPALEAESGWNYEAGADLWLGKKWKLSGSLFARRQQRLIDWVNTPYAQMPRRDNLVPTGSYALSTNIWQVNTRGAEVDVQYILPLGKHQSLTGQAGLLYLRNRGNEGTPSLYLSAQAWLMANMHITWAVGNWRISATALHKQREARPRLSSIDAELTPSYFLVNLKADYKFGSRWGIFAQADNVTNIRYSDILGSIMPRRWLMGGVNIQL